MSKILPLLTARSGLSERDVRLIISTAPARYKTYTIAKRDGGRRLISQPARELKGLQRILLTEVLTALPVHPAASAYRPGRSIRHNAEMHAANGPILKIDFKDFFPSLKARDWNIYCEKNNIFDNTADMQISTNLLFHRPKGSTVLRLAIGAPSSPHISNVIMNEFDALVTDTLAKTKVVYSRYADDLTFSAPRTGYLQYIEAGVRSILRKMRSPSLSINEKKTAFATKKYKRMITGLILADDGRVTIGRRRKHELRAALFRAQHGMLDDTELAKLSGLLAFVNDVEPAAYATILMQYGDQLIDSIKLVPRRLL